MYLFVLLGKANKQRKVGSVDQGAVAFVTGQMLEPDTQRLGVLFGWFEVLDRDKGP